MSHPMKNIKLSLSRVFAVLLALTLLTSSMVSWGQSRKTRAQERQAKELAELLAISNIATSWRIYWMKDLSLVKDPVLIEQIILKVDSGDDITDQWHAKKGLSSLFRVSQWTSRRHPAAIRVGDWNGFVQHLGSFGEVHTLFRKQWPTVEGNPSIFSGSSDASGVTIYGIDRRGRIHLEMRTEVPNLLSFQTTAMLRNGETLVLEQYVDKANYFILVTPYVVDGILSDTESSLDPEPQLESSPSG